MWVWVWLFTPAGLPLKLVCWLDPRVSLWRASLLKTFHRLLDGGGGGRVCRLSARGGLSLISTWGFVAYQHVGVCRLSARGGLSLISTWGFVAYQHVGVCRLSARGGLSLISTWGFVAYQHVGVCRLSARGGSYHLPRIHILNSHQCKCHYLY